MAYLLFVDESGHDRRESPYEVLAGLAIEDARTWDLIRAIHDAETEAFGCRISLRERELRALGDRVYRLRHHERNTPGDHGSFVMIDAL